MMPSSGLRSVIGASSRMAPDGGELPNLSTRFVAARWRLARFGLIVLGAIAIAFVLWVKLGDGIVLDAHAYWSASLADPYAGAATDAFPYLYSPAFLQAIAPLKLLPWPMFAAVWSAAEGGALLAVTGPFAILTLFLEPVLYELDLGNVNLMLAAAIVAGFRWPATWAFVLLTKVTPGVGLLWFAVRREWRSLGIALGVTAAIVAVSFAYAPALWAEWLVALSGRREESVIVPYWTLVPRLVAAAILVVIGARRGWRWTVPVAALLAMPALRYAMLAILVAVIPFLGQSRLITRKI